MPYGVISVSILGQYFPTVLQTDFDHRPKKIDAPHFATQGIRIRSLRSFDLAPNAPDQHVFLLNYSNLDVAQLPEALQHLQQAMHV